MKSVAKIGYGWVLFLIVSYRLIVLLLNSNIILDQDSRAYLILASNLADFGRYGMGPEGGSSWFMPGYPAFLAAVFTLLGKENLFAVRVIQQTLVVLTAVLASGITKRIFGKEAAIWTLAFAGFYPPFIFMANQIYTETVFGLLFVWWLYTLDWGIDEMRNYLTSGLVLGLTMMVRSVLFWIPGLIFIVSVIKKDPRVWAKTVMVTVGMVLVLMPWWIRNYQLTAKLIPFSLQGGEVLLGGTYLDYDYAADLDNWPVAETEWEMNQARGQLAKSRISTQLKSNPGSFWAWQVKKIYLLWSAPFYRDTNGLPPYKLVWLQHALMLGLSGLALIREKAKKKIIFPFGLLVAITLLHMMSVGIDRYNLPLMYLVMVLSGKQMADLVEGLNRKRILI